MVFFREDFDNQVFGISAASRGAAVACRELLQSDILTGYREQNEPGYGALVRGYEAVLHSKLSMALAVQGNIDAALVEGRTAYELAKGASFTRGLTSEQIIAMIAIDMAVITYCGRRNAHGAIRLLEGVQHTQGVWTAYALSVLGRILVETGQIEKGVARLAEAMRRGIDGPTASQQAAAVLAKAEKGQRLPDGLRLNIRLLVADA